MDPISQIQTISWSDRGVRAMLEDRKASILIVDDEAPVRDLMQVFLSEEYTCITASTSHQARTLLSSNFFNLVIVDTVLPDATGISLCEFIRNACPETVVILISGDLVKETITPHKAFDWIEKPFDLPRLQMAVDRALAYQKLKRNLN